VSPVRAAALTARIGFPLAWGACLVILGLWSIDEGWRWLPLRPATGAWIGSLLMAAGLFVFMVLVADRLLPRLGRRYSMWRLEMLVCLAMLASCAAVVVSYRGG
jgi:hypothetical protein